MAATLRTSPSSGQFVGSAVVAGATYGPHHTLLRLKTFRGELIDYRLGDVPDPAGIVDVSSNGLRPISVKIRDGGKQCSVVALAAAGGARALTVTLRTALALYKSGVHAVVDGGLSAPAPCTTRNAAVTALR
ncbi:hypothetical protein [Arthrobacter sp. NPDC057013]|uniref:hypothetical protein n=1 Tax=Arthrobacter sp. NPDC057013 TaxID=3345999 RepID=UPI003631E803